MRTVSDIWGDRFLSAALEPGEWQEVLGDLAYATGSAHAQLLGFGPGGSPFNWVSDVDPSVLEAADVVETATPDLNFRVAADVMSNGATILHEAHYDAARPTLRADHYLDLCSDLDIFNGCQARLLADGDLTVGLALLRSNRDGRTDSDQRATFAAAVPLAQVAARVQRAVERQGFAFISGAMEAMDKPCWLLDGTGRVGAFTPAAERLMANDRLRVVDGRLTADTMSDARRIASAVRCVLDPPRRPAPPIVLSEAPDGIDVVLDVLPLPPRPSSMGFAPRILVSARLSAVSGEAARALIDAYRLTPAEADVAIRLAAGATRPQIAAARGVTLDTLKAQIRNIYDKTGCSRESQLVRIVRLLGN